jgi:hypothetical protein
MEKALEQNLVTEELDVRPALRRTGCKEIGLIPVWLYSDGRREERLVIIPLTAAAPVTTARTYISSAG